MAMCALCVGLAGCYDSRSMRFLVTDGATNLPLPNVKLTTTYVPEQRYAILPRPERAETVTDDAGLAEMPIVRYPFGKTRLTIAGVAFPVAHSHLDTGALYRAERLRIEMLPTQ